MAEEFSIQPQTFSLDAVTLSGLTCGDQTRPVMLFLHGFPEYSGMWRRLMPAMADRFFCVAPDQRGYNMSSKPEGIPAYSAGELAGDMIDLIGQVSPDRPIRLVGHDWGAAVAYAIAIARPDLIDELIIINGVHPGPFQEALLRDPGQIEGSQYFHKLRALEADARLAADDCALLFKMFSAFSDLGWMTDAERAGYLAAWQQPGAIPAMLNWYRASAIYVPRIGEDTSARQNPFADTDKFRVRPRHLLIWGMKDAALRPSSHDGLEDFCEDLTRVEIADADHWVVNARPEAVITAIREFAVV